MGERVLLRQEHQAGPRRWSSSGSSRTHSADRCARRERCFLVIGSFGRRELLSCISVWTLIYLRIQPSVRTTFLVFTDFATASSELTGEKDRVPLGMHCMIR